MIARARGRGDGELVFNGCRISVWADEKVLKMDGGCTTMPMYLMTLNCAIKMVKVGPGPVVQLVRVSSQYTKVAGSIPTQGTHRNQPVRASVGGTRN